MNTPAKQQTKAISPLQGLKDAIARMDAQFKAALPSHMAAEKFIRVVQTAIQTNPDLVNANRTSFFAACMKAAQEGLLPDGREAALIPYNSKTNGKMVQYVPMVTGIMKKGRNSGEIGKWSSHVVKKNDVFEYQLGDDERIVHMPALTNRGSTIGAYSIVHLKSGEISHEFMSVEEIEAVRARSKASDNGPWKTDYDEMCKKTVIRRHSKRLPTSTDLEEIFRADDEMTDLDAPTLEERLQEKPVTPSRVSQLVEAQTNSHGAKSEEAEIVTNHEESEPVEDPYSDPF